MGKTISQNGRSGHKPAQRPVRKPKQENAPVIKKIYGLAGTTLFEKTESFLAGKMDKIFLASMILTFILGLLLFDIRFSLAGDDSTYVLRAYDFIRHFSFPSFQGPLYPVVLSPVVAVFGLSAIPLKAVSLLSMIGFIYFFYKSVRNRIPAILVASLLVLLPVNSFLLYYGSQTYSEAFFMFLQAVTFSLFFAFFIDRRESKPLMIALKQHLFLAVFLFLMGITRQIGFSAFIAVLVYFMLNMEWKNLLLSAVSFLVVFLVYQAVRYLFLDHTVFHFKTEFQGLVSKDYYKPSLGHETLTGFLTRLYVNFGFYLSKAFYTIAGFSGKDDTGGINPAVAIVTALLVSSPVLLYFRRNKYILFTGIYVVNTLFIIFLIAHTIWMQTRFIIPYFSMILLLMLASFLYVLSIRRLVTMQFILPVIVLLLFGMSVKVTIGQVAETRKIDSRFYGLTPDWENYCKASEWTSANLSGNALVACRKPSISFICSNGKNFFGITRLPLYTGGSLAESYRTGNVQYSLILASSLNNKPVSPKLSKEFSSGIVGYGMNIRDNFYEPRFYVLDFPANTREETIRELNSIGIGVTNKVDSLEAWLRDQDADISMVYPDTLLLTLLKAGVTHVLTDNVRAFANQPNNRVTNTVERYMNFIEGKYPGIRTKIYQAGENGNEPASIYELNYSRFGLKIPE